MDRFPYFFVNRSRSWIKLFPLRAASLLTCVLPFRFESPRLVRMFPFARRLLVLLFLTGKVYRSQRFGISRESCFSFSLVTTVLGKLKRISKAWGKGFEWKNAQISF